MNTFTAGLLLLALMALWAVQPLAAEIVYIDDEVLVGMHQNENLDSPIIKTIPSGTRLEVLQEGRTMSLIRDPDDVRGWVDQRYLTDDPPASVSLNAAKEQIRALRSELAETQGRLSDYEKYDIEKNNNKRFIALNKENDELRQLLKVERVRVGQLQGQIDDLRSSLNKNKETAGLLEQIDELSETNLELRKEIEALRNTPINETLSRNDSSRHAGPLTLLLAILVSLVIGLLVGLYLMDLYIRRRHGGFRV